ncbi:hypothetical protein F3Y22_tig00110847pilonHSYRG00289 [Hibiscus syriacus]|uniref:Uncharacterized protein n=1 Tax=Hibiscus syriacus TaxID=106335 RepID=A0A6A2ZKP9_HIBSY|nr:hypothetical protein F3Y22_tig00110847pilonHSYRG00289 [Hibiscus syriacus]
MRGNETRWSSGAGNGKVFDFMPEMRLNYIFNYTMYSDENKTYLSYSLYNNSLTRFLIHSSGRIGQSTWLESNQQWNMFWAHPREVCNIFNACGPFSCCSSDSCLCFRGFYPSEKRIIQGHEEACLNNCSCSAYAYNTRGHCSRWFGDLLDLQQLSAEDTSASTFFIRLAASEIDNGRGEMDDASQDILLFDVEMSITASRREFLDSDNPGKLTRKDTAFPLFRFASVSEATENFSLENKLGEGGFWPCLYGKTIKWKRSTSEKAFQSVQPRARRVINETMLIEKLQHRNLVRLLALLKAWALWEGDRGGELVDPRLEDQVSYPMLLRYIHVALLCVQEMAADRPTMSKVVSMLTNELTVLNSPKSLLSLMRQVKPMIQISLQHS